QACQGLNNQREAAGGGITKTAVEAHLRGLLAGNDAGAGIGWGTRRGGTGRGGTRRNMGKKKNTEQLSQKNPNQRKSAFLDWLWSLARPVASWPTPARR